MKEAGLINQPERNPFPLIERLPRSFRTSIYSGLTFLSLSVVACGGGSGNSESDAKDNSIGEQKAERMDDSPHEFIIPLRNISNPFYVRFTGGPHSDGLTGGVRAALDFAGTRPFSCKDTELQKEWVAVATAKGKVVVVGREDDLKDKNHSIVEVDHGGGLVTGYMHLADIRVKQGEDIEQGAILGRISCEKPPKGKAESPHLHFYTKKDGKYHSINGMEFSDWIFRSSKGNYQGTAEKNDQFRVANAVDCGPDVYTSIRECKNQRNDLDQGERLVKTPTPTVKVEPSPTAIPTKEALRGYRDPQQAAIDYFSEKFNKNPSKISRDNDCNFGSDFCVVKVGEGNDVVYYTAGAYATDGTPYLFVGKQSDGSWETVYFDDVSRALGSIGPNTPVKVMGSNDCLNVREQPSLLGRKLDCLKDGTTAVIEGEPVYADGYVWFHLRGRGWAVANYLGGYDPYDPRER